MTNVQHNVNTIEVNSSALPQTGISTEALPLNVNSYIDLLRAAGMPQDETQITIVTDAVKITLTTIGRRENTGPNSVRFWYDSARWGNRTYKLMYRLLKLYLSLCLSTIKGW